MSLLEPPQFILQLLRDSLPDHVGSGDIVDNSNGVEDVLAYVAFLAAGLCDAQEFAPATWNEALQPYLEKLVSNEETVQNFRDAAHKATMGDDDDDSYGDHDDNEQEVCNLKFKYVLFTSKVCWRV
jgi:hypothetical protein